MQSFLGNILDEDLRVPAFLASILDEDLRVPASGAHSLRRIYDNGGEDDENTFPTIVQRNGAALISRVLSAACRPCSVRRTAGEMTKGTSGTTMKHGTCKTSVSTAARRDTCIVLPIGYYLYRIQLGYIIKCTHWYYLSRIQFRYIM